jgi:hypothetical protein
MVRQDTIERNFIGRLGLKGFELSHVKKSGFEQHHASSEKGRGYGIAFP